MKNLDIIFKIILFAVICQGGQASSDDNSEHRRMQRSSFFVLKNTPNGLLATWDQTQSRENCQDKHPSCPTWGSQGECHHNPNYMVPNCAYTCNTCLIGVSNTNSFQSNINGELNGNTENGCSNTQGECDIVARENSNTLRSGIVSEAEAVFTTTTDTTDESANNASLTSQGTLAGKEILMVAAESVASSAREYAMECRDLSTVCPTLAAQGNCTSNPAFMLVNCPISCDSCLPTEPSECVNKGDDDSCDLSAILGLCEVNYAYNLRFCSGSCKMTQSLRHKCIQKPVLSCPGLRSLRTPDFKCGVPLNRRKRLAVSIPPVQPREPRRLRKPNTNTKTKNNKRKRKRKQDKNKSVERTSGTANENTMPVVSTEDISNKQADISLDTSDEAASGRQGAICCSGLIDSMPTARQAGCTGDACDLVCSTDFNCECCDTRLFLPEETIPIWPVVFGLPLAIIPFLPGAPAVPAAAAPPPPPPPPPPQPALQPAPIQPAVQPTVTPIFPAAPIVPLIIAPVILAVPPLLAISGITSIPDTVATRRAARSLLPFCDPNSYLELLKQLAALTATNTGNPLDPQVTEITRAIIHCRHGVGQLPPLLAANITTETAFGNISHTEVAPPPNYPGVSYPGLDEELAGIAPGMGGGQAGIAPGMDGRPTGIAPGMDGGPEGISPGLGEELVPLAGIGAVGMAGEVTDNDRNRFFCGAALITNRHVLTAAHCLVHKSQKPEVIRLGERDFTTMEESRSFDYNVKKITLHPEYNIYSGGNDIAVIELVEEVTVERSGNLLPYCLPSEPQNLDGTICTFSGWGTRPNTLASTLLVNVNVTVRSLDECKAKYSQAAELFRLAYPRNLDETSLCASGDEGEDACRGDSGGPLVFRSGGGSDKAEEVGIVSQGVGCGDPEFPGIYTRTDAYLDWLDEVVYQETNEEICS